ncbi:mannose-6-phosphate isomerase [Wenjunlia vitaminophila]|uniref:Mannose-6-phosphate isomerase n=1 Tax=Wenjunlia vitaminophila TaxID=76728 RepID=A0A0T6LRP5_WENVI|nr:SIS domain-containing protein [Wenjunlia vitaminophila]KRV48720.1 mannose-6-phosphate isomerase [Wenjunlia vitaminophila]
MFDEALLDDHEELTRVDTHELLRGLASAGARVRTAARLADEAGLAALRPDGRPRVVLVAGSGAGTEAGELLAAITGTAVPVLTLAPRSTADPEPRWALPGWAGPLDLLLLATESGQEPGLAQLAEQAYARGCTVVAVAPPDSAVVSAAQRARGMSLPLAPPPGGGPDQDPTALWALLVPLLALSDRIGTGSFPAGTIQRAADRLDETAAHCGPATSTYQNPAKTLAAELADTLPLLWGEGTAAPAVARCFAGALARRAGLPALAAPLPQALHAHRGLLAGPLSQTVDDDDFFRDRVEDPAGLRLRVVLLRDRGEHAAGSDATPAHLLSRSHGVALSEVTAEAEGPLEAAAQMLALTDFASAYLALAERA